jgi:Fic-DOC domain mobile mystery protein B
MSTPFRDTLPDETPIDDVSGLKIKGISTRSQLSLAEGENIRKVLAKYFMDGPKRSIDRFDAVWAIGLHREMFEDVWEWAGKFRNCDLNIGCSWHQVGQRLGQLFADLEYWEANEFDLIEQSARLHHGAVFIHPFLNGNGRWARMLTNIWLALHESPEVAWPEHLIGSTSPIRGDYIAALRAADGGDLSPLIELHRKHMQDSD